MSDNSKKNKPKEDWGRGSPPLTPEQIVAWLEGHRQLMWEIWKNNPGTYEVWKKKQA